MQSEKKQGFEYCKTNLIFRLILGARSEQELRKVVEECKKSGGEAHYIVTDVSKEEDCK